jgi:hypothetical protein
MHNRQTTSSDASYSSQVLNDFFDSYRNQNSTSFSAEVIVHVVSHFGVDEDD